VDDSPLPRLERYDDAVSRATARTKEHGPLTLFVADRGWPYYARPRVGLHDAVRRDEVDAVAAGRTVQAGAFDATVGAVGGGSHNPRGTVSEIVGVGVLPAYRRRGLAAALTALLATDATGRGVTTAFCAAGSEDLARVHEHIGFRRVGTACIAEKG
jgi:ribosomal protein S18 acetylase RimI-like enzyme